MTFQRGSVAQSRNKVMSPEQFKQVVDAITEGRYSWACVLILRFAGYNPVHFIPHRTYSRLLKENRVQTPSRLTQIKDLAYSETVEQPEEVLHGGKLPIWFVNSPPCEQLKAQPVYSIW
ncbi:HetP family heterocyst commitment protein [Leptolyngbya boryana CZ1]|jgi:hypothetical protein|uniref:Heterocyst differentiation protein n=2 Tax=Leptolyngbya boryana TaxID=1184 RepID=A0A1Z4JQJ4_LEPBY|nr:MULTISPECIES: HetP family heterocyst commitment protein [Leptolyngbya]BAY58979.1 heterocyst differentiation protein [Leptolyngbya boryana NIES-2135]MBD1855275.1 HetP family heterocyst commitment protein [Leptolyngbya sp. FACHB-1624]MBD2368270.1 HetP family heterocyst commitment protein [Leptolyngbya sp. FACHB-161]MBD2374690.1 HetP family heterocyst commitment protein [Leptolyngbya sp. FACHB-238]MBD2399112.1 HetP family heterocyst commitment protein [Leptolyngbya sp. FACHB-239]